MGLLDGVDEDRFQRAGELLTLARCHQGDTEGAVEAGRTLVQRAGRGEGAGARANAWAALAVALVLSGEPEQAAECYEEALAAAVEAGDAVREVHVLSDLAGCAYLTGQHADSVALLTRARQRADGIGYRRHLALNLNNEAQLRAALGDPYATLCAAVAIDRSLGLGDLATAADALHTWVTARPVLAADAALWRRLARLAEALDRFLEAAVDWAELAVVLARAGQSDAARDAADRAETCARGSGAAEVEQRVAFARLLADAHRRKGSAALAAVLEALGRLAADTADRDGAEVALERWRLTRSDEARAVAVSLVRQAFAVEPSAVVRAWLRHLGEPLPELSDALPAPVGIPLERSTRQDLERAMAAVEAAVSGRASPEHPADDMG
jgi:hypothetical protein